MLSAVGTDFTSFRENRMYAKGKWQEEEEPPLNSEDKIKGSSE